MMPESINSIPSPLKIPKKGLFPIDSGGKKIEIPQQTAEVNESSKLSLIDKSCMGWGLIGERLYENKVLQSYHTGKEKLKEAAVRPFKKIIDKIKEWASDDNADEIKAVSKNNIDKFGKTIKDFPNEEYINNPENTTSDEFWEKHPIMHSIYLGFKAIKRIPRFIPKLLLKIPRMLFKVVFPAAYAESGKGVGSKFISKLVDTATKNPAIKKGYEKYTNLMKIPGVSLGMSIVGPIFGVSRMMDGINQYHEGKKDNNSLQKLEGKVEIVSGALAAIKPLALLSVVTEGAHMYLTHRVKNKGMDPARADHIMTRVFSAATAPIGLTAYALLSPMKNDGIKKKA